MRNTWLGRELVAHLLAEAAHVALGHVRRNDDRNHRASIIRDLQHWLLRVLRELRNGIDTNLEVFQHLPGIEPFLDFDHDRCTAGRGRGVDVLDTRNLLDRFFDLQHDHLFHFLGSRGGIRH